jgi:hypothetical protein
MMKQKCGWTEQELKNIDDAMQEAAQEARRIAIATNTPIVLWEDGKVVEKWPGDKGW